MSRSAEQFVRVVTAMSHPDFSPKSMAEIAKQAGLAETTTWRILKSLEKQGWTTHNPKDHAWILGSPIIKLAHAHRRYMLNKMNSIQSDYESIAGESLGHDR